MSNSILCLNSIAERGLESLREKGFKLGTQIKQPDGILLRSHHLRAEDIPKSVQGVARAGAGVNNIDVSGCTARGIPVFNTPGGNANAVKELVLAALLLCSRGILPGIHYLESLSHIRDVKEMTQKMEAKKKDFKGVDLAMRSLGVIGLGAVGARVADIALTMGMKVLGYDPALSVDNAWRLPRNVERCDSLEQLTRQADYISLHVPALDSTLSLVDKGFLTQCKKGTRLLNFSRAEVIDVQAVCTALKSGILSAYVADFPHPDLIGMEGVIFMPHLGASTIEAEENCALMAADQLYDFLYSGNITNSVNYPSIHLAWNGKYRLALSNHNVPKMLNSVLETLGNATINVSELLNKSRGDIAYNLIDIDKNPNQQCIDALRNLDGIIGVRVIKH